MDEIGLYYPYFHVRDDAWLKAAALYMPQVARVRPPGYPIRDSPTAVVLREELDFLRGVAPGEQGTAVSEELASLVQREESALRAKYQVSRSPQQSGFTGEIKNRWYLDESRFAWLHVSQLGSSRTVIDHLQDAGLALTTRFDPLTGERDDFNWVGMHPHLVAVYSCALANRIAEANMLTPVTHDPRLFALPGDWTVDELAVRLLEGTRKSTAEPASTSYACAAVQAVLPADIAEVPVEKLVRARRVLSDEFDAFRAHVDGLRSEFSLLDSIDDAGILHDRIAGMVERDITKQVRELERGLRTLGLQPVRAVLGMKSLELPAIAALAANAASLSPVAGAGGAIAIQLVAATRSARQAAAARRTSAGGYLLGLRRHLGPASVLTRVRHALSGG